MTKHLFKDFDPVSAKQWKQKIHFDLKGADYNESLIWTSNEGISVKPFYHADDFNEGSESFLNTKEASWNVCQSIFVANVKNSNLKALDAIKRGAESIKFTIPNEHTSIEELLKNITPTSTLLYFDLQFLNNDYVNRIIDYTKPASASNKTVKLYVQTDIIGHLAKTGNWFNNLKSDHEAFKSIVKNTNTFGINGALYQNAGANIVQQLAYSLAHANEYLNTIEKHITEENKSTLKVVFEISVGTNYFFEIAKIRALRMLWHTLAQEYQVNPDCHIIALPSKRNKTIYDYNTNMLRSTTECMSAILGGANTICNLPYDSIYHKNNEFGERIARNQLLILKHESYFNKVHNPADGAYYIESLTQQLAEKSLELFKAIESQGGFLEQLKKGTIQRKIKESASQEQQQFDNNEEVLLGSNLHPNLNDKIKDELELYPFLKTNSRKTLIAPIIEKRLAEQLEKKRLKTE